MLLLVLLGAGCPAEYDPRNCATRIAFYPDPDGDGYGDPSEVFVGCEAPPGWVSQLAPGDPVPTGETGAPPAPTGETGAPPAPTGETGAPPAPTGDTGAPETGDTGAGHSGDTGRADTGRSDTAAPAPDTGTAETADTGAP